MFKMGLHDPFGHLKHKLWPKEASRIAPISLHVGCVLYIVGNLSTRATTLLQTSFQSEVFTQSCGRPQSYGSPIFGNFGIPIWESWDKMTFGCSLRG